MVRLVFLAVFGVSVSVLLINYSFAQDSGGTKNAEKTTIEKLSPESIQQAIEKAIKGINSQEQAEEARLKAELNSKLDQFIQKWVIDAGDKKKAELNKFLHQDWDIPARAVYPIPFDYYLRDYAYTLGKKDCLETDSLSAPYKAIVNIIEKQFIESYHASAASDKRQYYYTVTREITIDLDYQQDRLDIANINYGPASFERGWKK